MILTDEETDALARLLSRTIEDDRYPPSPRIRTLKSILAKIRPEPAREPLPANTSMKPAVAPARDQHSQLALITVAAVRIRLVWGFFCQAGVFGFLSVLCSEREGRSSSRRLRSCSRSARKGSRDRNASGAWRLAA